jgi:hypothetical protein
VASSFLDSFEGVSLQGGEGVVSNFLGSFVVCLCNYS